MAMIETASGRHQAVDRARRVMIGNERCDPEIGQWRTSLVGADGGRMCWAHFELTRTNTELTILCKKVIAPNRREWVEKIDASITQMAAAPAEEPTVPAKTPDLFGQDFI